MQFYDLLQIMDNYVDHSKLDDDDDEEEDDDGKSDEKLVVEQRIRVTNDKGAEKVS